MKIKKMPLVEIVTSHDQVWSMDPARSRAVAAYPELKSSLDSIDAAEEFTMTFEDTTERRILVKIDAYESWLRKHGLKPLHRGSKLQFGRILVLLGHPQAENTPAVKARLDQLAGMLHPDGLPYRHQPEQPIDAHLDAYAAALVLRGYGTPRSVGSGRFSRSAIAADMTATLGVVVVGEDLDVLAMSRVRVINADLPPSWTPERSTRKDDAKHADGMIARTAAMLARAIAARPDGLPADPLNHNMVDIPLLAEEAGVSVFDIDRDPSHRQAIEAARTKPLVPHPMLAERRYRFKDLSELGRESIRQEKLRKDKDGTETSVDSPGDREAKTADPVAEEKANMTARGFVFALSSFLKLPQVNLSWDDQVPSNLRDLIANAIDSRPEGVPQGWAVKMRRWIEIDMALRASKPLPTCFATALKIMLVEACKTRIQIGREVPSNNFATVAKWLDGRAIPSFKAKQLVGKLEDLLLVATGTVSGLLSSEWRKHMFENARYGNATLGRLLPPHFADLLEDEKQDLKRKQYRKIVAQDLEYARRQADRSADRYFLKKSQWPSVFEATLRSQIPVDARQKRVMRPGEQRKVQKTTPSGKKRWIRKDEWRNGTVTAVETVMESMLGFFVRPPIVPQEVASARRLTDFIPEGGLGIPMRFLHPIVFAFQEVVSAYCWWLSRRAGQDVANGGVLLRPLAVAADFLRPETGSVWKSEKEMKGPLLEFVEWWNANTEETVDGKILLDATPFINDWKAAVSDTFAKLTDDFYAVRSGDMPKSRNSFLTVGTFLEESTEPMVKYMRGVHALLNSRPLHALSIHSHRRDCVMTQILIQTALRANTLLLTISGPEPTLRKIMHEDGSWNWRIVIPAKRFKNFDSPYFAKGAPYEIDLVDENDLYERLEQYLEVSRVYLLKGNESDALFINRFGGDFTAKSVNKRYRQITSYYFVHNPETGSGAVEGAVSHGPHAVRHVIATHVLKTTGDIYLAAWMIQDQPETVVRWYGRFIPADKVRLASALIATARQRGWDLASKSAVKPVAASVMA